MFGKNQQNMIQSDGFTMCVLWYVLVNDGCVGHSVLIYNRHHQRDQFGPEVQVLDGRTLFLTRQILLL